MTEEFNEENIRKRLIKAMKKVGKAVAAQATKNAPVDTGHLRSRIGSSVNEYDLTVTIGTNVEYAPYVEYGSARMIAAHGVHDPLNPVREWEAKTKRGGGARQIMPFLRPALFQSKRTIIRLMKEEFQ